MATPAPASSETAVPHAQQNPLSRKLSKILETNLDSDKDTLEALGVLSSFLEKNTLQARRNLRSDLEKRSLALNQDFLQCAAQLVERVQGVQQEAGAMKACCDDMQQRLHAAKTRTSDLLKETSELQSRSKQLEMKAKVVDTFLDKFELKPEEREVLNAPRNGAISDSFFKVMDRVKRIHEDCKVLLRTSQQRAGLEVMEAMAMHLETAYEQLYHWTQQRCRSLNTDYPEIDPNLRAALKELQHRPILLQYCVDEYSIARRMALVRCFIDALTREGSSGRPIELHSHDPVRYCGDMLGWLHQAIATENDHIAGLLGEQSSDKAVQILGMVTEGACRPLHVRIEQVIVSTADAVVAYKLVNHLRYYAGVFHSLLNPTSPLVKTVSDLSELQSKRFFSTLNSQISKILEGLEPPLADLTPTTKEAELLALLQKILASRDMTVLASEHQEQDLKLILSSCIDPLIQFCNETVSGLSRVERSVYMVNCLYLTKSTISLYEFTERQVESLDMQIQSYLATLVSEQCSHTLEAVGLASVWNTVKHKQKLGAEEFTAIAESGENLTQFVSAPDQLLLPQCRLLSSARLREELQRRASGLFCEAYEGVFSAVEGERGEGEGGLAHTPQQVSQLLL